MQQHLPFFKSKKYVLIDHVAIRYLRLVLYAGLFSFVLVYQCLYKGCHLELVDVDGDARFYLSAPTIGIPECYEYITGCEEDSRKPEDLPYCQQNTAAKASDVKPCWYFGGDELVKAIPNGGILVPTRIKIYKRHIASGCHVQKYPFPCEINNHTGVHYGFVNRDGEFQTKLDSSVEPTEDAFVGDIENFMVSIDHSFSMGMGANIFPDEVRRHDGMAGYWCHAADPNSKTSQTCLEGERRHPILCLGKHCPEGNPSIEVLSHEGIDQPESYDGPRGQLHHKFNMKVADKVSLNTERTSDMKDYPIYKFKFGDSFRLESLLRIANVTLENSLASSTTGSERTLRAGGGTLYIEIDYRNGMTPEGKPKWVGLKTTPSFLCVDPHVEPPDYTYTVRFLPHATMNIDEVPDWKRQNETQDIYKYTGIRLFLKQRGEIALWSNSRALLVVVSMSSLMAGIQWVLEKLSMLAGYTGSMVEKVALPDLHEQPAAV